MAERLIPRPEYADKDVTAVNRMGAHSPMGAYETPEQALRGEASKYVMCLDGLWDFAVVENPGGAGDFYRPDFDLKDFGKITVPGNWETQGFDEPIYTNLVFPWDYEKDEECNIRPSAGGEKRPNPPCIPAHNPTGCYRRSFLLPQAFLGRRVSVVFEGVETAFYLWLNGSQVGYSEDSKLPAEFDLTPYLQPGENVIALQVMRFSTATYLEDQDYWYLSGIHRSVSLIAKPALAIEDYKLDAVPDLHSLAGTVTADVTVTRAEGFADCRVKLAIFDGEGLLGEELGTVMPIARYRSQEQPTANTARVCVKLPKVELWTPETPKLYRVVVTLLSKEGRVLDAEACSTGFKKVEIRQGIVLLNGKRLVVRGVNRHEHWPMGRSVPRSHMIEEIKQMKRMHINSVRSCHYPDSSMWHELCDQYGLLLICECNLETHGVEGQLSHNPDWAASYLERAVRMVQTHKNHVSVYSWSLGNESGTGPNHAAMYGFIKAYDPYRLCQYEAGEPGKNISDIRGNMYATLDKIGAMLTDPQDDRPIILVEYLYQICNSGGGAAKFRSLTEKYPRFQGGYVWDWQDKCLLAKTPEGEEFFGYGGDFGERYVEKTNPPFMTNNGLVLPDLRWKPVAHELKAVYAPVYVCKPEIPSAWHKTPEESRYVIKNRTMTQPLSDFVCTAYLREDGRIIAQAPVPLPQEEGEFSFEIPHSKRRGCEYHLDFVVTRKAPLWYEEPGDICARTQFTLLGGGAAERPVAPGPVQLEESGGRVVLTAGESRWTLCKKTGRLLLGERGGRAYVKDSLTPCFNRPKTGLDAEPGWGWYDELRAFDSLRVQSPACRIMKGQGLVRAEFSYLYSTQAGAFCTAELSYTVEGDGRLQVDYQAEVERHIAVLPRVGLTLVVQPGFEKLRYFGRGENESYCDRHESAPLGVYESTVEGQHFPFIPPSENGGHEDTRWLSLEDGDGGVLTVGGRPFHFDIHHSTVEDYLAADHDHQLPKRPESYLHIDAHHAQIGSEMAWSTALDQSLTRGGGSYSQRFSLRME